MTSTNTAHIKKLSPKTTHQHQSTTTVRWNEIVDFQQQAQQKKSRLAQLAQLWQRYLEQLENKALKNNLLTKVIALIQTDVSLPTPPSDRLLLELNLAFSDGTLITYKQYTKIIANNVGLEHYPVFYDKQHVFSHFIVSHHLEKVLSLDSHEQQNDALESMIEESDLATFKNHITHLEILFTRHCTTEGEFQTFVNDQYGFQHYQNLLKQVPLLVQHLQVLLLQLTQQTRLLQQLKNQLGHELDSNTLEEIIAAICPTPESKAQLQQHRELLLQQIDGRLCNNLTSSDQILSMQRQLHECAAEYIRFKTKTAQVTSVDHQQHNTSLFTKVASSAAATISEPIESLLDKFDAAVQKFSDQPDLMADDDNNYSKTEQTLLPKLAKKNRYLTNLV